ncbi:MAG: hypothetical protein KH415_20015 [Clostridium sp.]|nr:hypothetical protein [Clostridium sp.]
MIHDFIEKALKDVGILVEHQTTETYDDKYIIYSIYSNSEFANYDNENEEELYRINLSYYYKNKEDINLIKNIKDCMKEGGFYFNDGKELRKESNYFGYSLYFIYECMKEE